MFWDPNDSSKPRCLLESRDGVKKIVINFSSVDNELAWNAIYEKHTDEKHEIKK